MLFGKGLFGCRAVPRMLAGLIALAGVPAGSGYAATFNQNLNIWEGAERAHQEMIAQASPQPGQVPLTVVPAPTKPVSKPTKELPKGLNGPPPSEAVNRALAPPPADPSVPLPRADLARQSSSGGDASDSPVGGPHVYGRTEQGNNGSMGVLMGVKIPIPADRNSASPPTISGNGPTSVDSSDSGR